MQLGYTAQYWHFIEIKIQYDTNFVYYEGLTSHCIINIKTEVLIFIGEVVNHTHNPFKVLLHLTLQFLKNYI